MRTTELELIVDRLRGYDEKEYFDVVKAEKRKMYIHLNKMNFPFGNIGSAHRGCRQ